MSTDGAPEGWLEDYSFDGDLGIGILLLHGFTGSPASMRPWAHFLKERGFSVRLPRIPGHARRWQDLNRTKWQSWPERAEQELMDLLKKNQKVFIFGLSMGGANTLYLAAKHSARLKGIVLVNPMIHIPDPTIKFIEIIKYLTPKRPSVGDDIKKPGVTEWGYDALPMKGVAQLNRFLKATRANLKGVTCPVLLFHSVDDHVLPVSNTEIVMSEIGAKDKRRIELTNSFHVATLDYDDTTIFENTDLFVQEKIK
jgi:carboxylesterase